MTGLEAGELHRRAEEQARRMLGQQPETSETLTTEAAQQLIGELRVRLIELEIQNEALRESEERFRSMVENAAEFVYCLTPQGCISYVSPNWLEMIDSRAETPIGHSIAEFVHPDDQAACYEVLQRMIDSGRKNGGIEYRVRDKKGEWRWHSSTATPIIGSNGSVVLFIGTALDITDRKKAEEALQASEIRYRTLLDQTFEALALVDIETQELVEVNRKFTQLFGYSLPEDSPLYVKDFVLDSKRNLDRLFRSTLRKQRVFPTVERVVRHKNGTMVPVERAGSVISLAGREYYLVSMRDMTEERSRQAELKRDAEVARRVQQALLPALSDSPFVAIRTLYYPAHFVSGDSYHMEWLNDRNLLRCFLIDVSGHGIATALQTSSIIVLLREVVTARMPLYSQLRRINARVAKYFIDGAYAAMIGFELDFPAKELRYVGAGITRFYANGVKIESAGTPVGLLDSLDFTEGSLPIQSGDVFHFLTDGFSDWLERPENRGFLSQGWKDFEADMASLEQLGRSRTLRDDATGICLKIGELG